MAWMNAESLQRTFAEGRTVFWSRSRQELWRKGDTSGDRQFVREAYYDCDGDTLLFVVEQEGKGACHTGKYSCFFRAFGPRPSGDQRSPAARRRRLTACSDPRATSSASSPPPTPSCPSGASCWPTSSPRSPPSPVSAATTSPASCSSRSSTASAGAAGRSSGRNPLATLVLRDGVVEVDRRPARGPADRSGHPGRGRGLLERYRSPVLEDLPAAARRPRRLPRLRRRARGRAPARRAARRRPGYPDAVLSVIGQLAAFDHFRQRVTLIDNVLVPEGADDADSRPPLRRGPRPARPPGHRRRPPARRAHGRAARAAIRELPEVAQLDVARAVRPGASRSAKEHILAGDIFQVVLSQRFSFELDADPFDFYRVLRQVNPSPYMYFVRTPELSLVGSSPEPMVQLRRRHGDLPAHRRHPASRPHRGGGPAPRRRAAGAPQGGRRARHARRPGPQRRRAGGALRHREGRRDDDARALQPRDAPHLAGVGRAGRGPHPDRRAAGDAARPARCPGRPRCGPWRSSTTSSR